MENVPVIDLEAADQSKTVVAALDAALRTFGFFYVTNHGIPRDLIDRQFQIAAELFALPVSEKESMIFDAEMDIGYVGCGVQSLDPDASVQTVADTKEQFMMTNNKLLVLGGEDTSCNKPPKNCEKVAIDPDNVFEGSRNYEPAVKDHAKVTREYASAAYKLNNRLNELLFDALDLNDACHKDASSMRRTLGDNPFVVLKQMKYSAGDPSDPTMGKFGAGAHTDWGSFTILATDEQPGLQIRMQDEWLPVPPRPDCLIINSGDQIAHLTNDRYRSSLHRVVVKSAPGNNNKPRFSTAVFTYFGIQAEVAPLPWTVTPERPARYPSGRTTQEYFHFKLGESMLGKNV